jgi:dihydrofolate reductase
LKPGQHAAGLAPHQVERHSARGRHRRRRAQLKEQPGGDILEVGTGGSFSRTLLEHRLVDEYLFWLFPVIAGSGERLYDGIKSRDFDLIDVKRLAETHPSP